MLEIFHLMVDIIGKETLRESADYSVLDDFNVTNITKDINDKHQEIEGNINEFLKNLNTSTLFDSNLEIN